MNLNKSKTFTTVEKLCRLYLGQPSETFAEVKEKKMYIMWTDVAEQAVLKFNTVPDNPVICVNDLDKYSRYFKSRDGLNRQW